MSVIGRTIDPEYNEPLIPVLTFKNRAGTKTILTHNVADGDNTGLAPFEITVESGIRKTGVFTLRCYDDAGFFSNGDIRHRGRVNIKAKKESQSEYEDLINGLIIDISKEENYDGGNEVWTITGQSMKHIWSHTFVEYTRHVPFLNLKENQLNLKNTDKKYYIGNIIYDIFTNRDIFPNNNGYNLQERGNFTLNGIDRTIPLTIPSIDYTGQVDNLLNSLVESGGLIIGTDRKNDVFAKFPIFKSTGHILKTKTGYNDNPDYTCYTRAAISMGSSTDPGQYAEVIIGQAATAQVVANNTSTNNFTTLFDKDIAQQVELRSTELYDLTLILSKLNAGTDSDNPENTNLRAFIATDENGTIGKDIVAELSIPLRDIPATPEAISRRNITFKRPVDVTKKYWLVLQEMGSSDNNTILWWHDDGYASSNGIATICAVRDVPYGRGEGQAYIPTGWKYFRNQQTYSNAFTSNTPILHVSNVIYNGDPDDYADPAPVEVLQSPSYIHDSASLIQHMAIFNEYSSRIAKSYDFGRISVPNKLLEPGTSIVYVDTRGVQYAINLTDVNYSFSLDEGEIFGTKDCQIQGLAYMMPSAGDNLNSEAELSTFYCY